MLRAADAGYGYGGTSGGGDAFTLADVSLEVARGGFVGLLGPNGCGKTTLLKLLGGTLTTRTGAVTLDGEELAGMSRRRIAQRIAVVPQETHPTFDFTVQEMVLMGRHPHLGPLTLEGPDDIGIAQGALDEFVEGLRHRITRYSGRNVADFTTVQVKIAESAACIDTARLIMRSHCTEAHRIAEAGEVPDILTKVRWRRDGAFSTELCVRAVDVLFKASGGSGLYDSNPIQRAFRDVHAAAAHISMIWDAQATTYGRVVLGLSPDNLTL